MVTTQGDGPGLCNFVHKAQVSIRPKARILPKQVQHHEPIFGALAVRLYVPALGQGKSLYLMTHLSKTGKHI